MVTAMPAAAQAAASQAARSLNLHDAAAPPPLMMHLTAPQLQPRRGL
jgi:hypothetical protein